MGLPFSYSLRATNQYCLCKLVPTTWSRIVNPLDPEDRCSHLEFGTSVDYIKGLQSKDANQVSVYFTKHRSSNFGDREYQYRSLDLWLEPGSTGRIWGYWGLTPAINKTELSQTDALFVSRTLRRWARANGERRKTTVAKINKQTGEISSRKVLRYPRDIAEPLVFVSVNDGSVMGARLASAIQSCRR